MGTLLWLKHSIKTTFCFPTEYSWLCKEFPFPFTCSHPKFLENQNGQSGSSFCLLNTTQYHSTWSRTRTKGMSAWPICMQPFLTKLFLAVLAQAAPLRARSQDLIHRSISGVTDVLKTQALRVWYWISPASDKKQSASKHRIQWVHAPAIHQTSHVYSSGSMQKTPLTPSKMLLTECGRKN